MAKSIKERLEGQMRRMPPVAYPDPEPDPESKSESKPLVQTQQEPECRVVMKANSIVIEIPIGGERDPSLQRGPIHLDGVDLTRDQSEKLRRITDALDKAGATCETRSGRRRVTTWRHTIRWIFDQVEG
jgi:hypothetical protein